MTSCCCTTWWMKSRSAPEKPLQPFICSFTLDTGSQLWAFWHGQQCLVSDHLAAALEKNMHICLLRLPQPAWRRMAPSVGDVLSQRSGCQYNEVLIPSALAFDFSPVYTQSFRRRGQALDLWSNTQSCVHQAYVTGDNDTLARAT